MENLIERVAHFADIDTRRALGFGPRKLFISEFTLGNPIAISVGFRPATKIILNQNASIVATVNGTVEWKFGTVSYMYYRDGRPARITNLGDFCLRLL
jgi:hypothetical protein